MRFLELHHRCTKCESLGRRSDICVYRSSSRSREKHCWKIIMEVKVMSSCLIKSICHLSFALCPYCCLLFYIFVFLSTSLLLNFPPFLNLQLLVLLTFHSSYQKFFFLFYGEGRSHWNELYLYSNFNIFSVWLGTGCTFPLCDSDATTLWLKSIILNFSFHFSLL